MWWLSDSARSKRTLEDIWAPRIGPAATAILRRRKALAVVPGMIFLITAVVARVSGSPYGVREVALYGLLMVGLFLLQRRLDRRVIDAAAAYLDIEIPAGSGRIFSSSRRFDSWLTRQRTGTTAG